MDAARASAPPTRGGADARTQSLALHSGGSRSVRRAVWRHAFLAFEVVEGVDASWKSVRILGHGRPAAGDLGRPYAIWEICIAVLGPKDLR